VQYQLSRIVAGPFLHTIWRPKVTGAEHIPASGGAIIAANHQSVVDSVFLPLMLDRPVTFSAKAEYFTAAKPLDRPAPVPPDTSPALPRRPERSQPGEPCGPPGWLCSRRYFGVGALALDGW
jgi:hypothetical protein